MFRTETQHALRALAALAAGEAPLSIAMLADRTGAPAPTLGKVLHRLSLLGFVTGRTGRGGGYRLARPAAELHLMDLVLAFEGPGFARQCLFGMPRCSDKQPCPLHSTWARVREGLLELVERRSVADLAPHGSLTESAR
ncbi:MAG: Rrf2 family transcriptional regulator [bacterium]